MSLPTGKTPFIQFDASDNATITKSGTTLTNWTNKGSASGSTTTINGTVSTGTSSYNSKNLMVFPSSSRAQITNITLPSQAYYAFVVTKITSITDYVGFLMNYDMGGPMFLANNNPTDGHNVGVGPNGIRQNVWARNIPNFVSSTKPSLFAICNSSVSISNNRFKYNGTSYTLATGNYDQGIHGYNITQARTYFMNLYSGSQEMGEMVIFGTDLTTDEINDAEGYMAWKWGIQSDLNVAHPYYPAKVAVNTPTFSGGAVSLSWTAGIYTAFKVYRDTQTSGATKTLLTTTSSTSYSDTSVSTGLTYHYFVEGAIQSTYSNLMSDVKSASTSSAPSKLAAPTIDSAGNQTITIRWVSPTAENNGGSAVTGYTIKIYNETASTSTTTSADAGDTEKTISSLVNGNSYTFTIVATNGIGSSDESIKSVASVPGLIPAQPAAPSVTSIGNGTATIQWGAPVSVPAITGYTITIYNLTATTSTTTSAAAGETSKAIGSLTNGSSYSFTIMAVNNIGPSIESVASDITIPYTVPGAPTSVSATPESLRALVTWTKPANNNGRAVSSYTITALQNGNPVLTPVVINGEDNTGGYVFGLSNSTAYTFTVKATNLAGDSSASSASEPVTPDSDAPTTAVTTALSTGNTATITNYINDTVATTPEETADLTIEMRLSLKAATGNSTTQQKVDTKLAYIDAMRAKVGTDNFTIPSDKFTDFIRTLNTVTSEPLVPKPIVSFVPVFTASSATVDVAGVSEADYLQFEVPVGYSIVLQNGANSIRLTYNGTNYSDDNANTYTAGSVIVLGSKTFTLIGIGTGAFGVQDNEQIICITKGSKILTPNGEVAVETLRVGDSVLTGEGRTVPITKMQQIVVVAASAINAPYVIEKDAFGLGVPPNRLEVSPRHAIQLPHGLWEIPREAANVNKMVYQNKAMIGKQVVYYHYALSNYATDTTVVNGQVTECLNDGQVKESYLWNEAKQGYVRTLHPVQKNVMKKH